jgi:hypothetical protein
MRLACYAVTKVGLALQERTTKTATELYRESVSDFVQLVNTCDVVMLCQQSLRTDSPSTNDIATIKAMLIRDYGECEGDNKVNTNYILLLMATLIIYQS